MTTLRAWIIPPPRPMTEAEFAQLLALTSKLFAGTARLEEVHPTLLERATTEIRRLNLLANGAGETSQRREK